MFSSYSHTSNFRFHRCDSTLGVFQWPPRLTVTVSVKNFMESPIKRVFADSYSGVMPKASNFHMTGFYQLRNLSEVRAFDQDSFDFGIPSLDNFGDDEGTAGYVLPSSDGEDSDPDIILHPVSDVDLPTSVAVQNNDALTVTAHRLGMLGRGRKRYRIRHGVFTNMGLIVFLLLLLLYVDWCAWRIVRLPLGPFHLTGPFLTSALLASCAGYICVPLLYQLKVYESVRQEKPARHALKRKTPTMGGLFFVPIGIAVAKFFAGFSSIDVSAASVATIAFFAIGLVDDILSLINSHNCCLSAWIKFLLQVAIGTWFCFWLGASSVSSPYSMYTFLY